MTTIESSRPSLTSNDSAVLQALFDAESSPSSAVTINPSLPPFPAHLEISPAEYETLKSRELAIVRTLQPSHVAKDVVQSAVKELDSLINEHPLYPPAYANRAQALRMLMDLPSDESSTGQSDSDERLFEPDNAKVLSDLLSDLGQAISLATPRSPADPVSSVQARILADSHTHRGYLLLKAAKKKDLSVKKLQKVGADQLEEMASRDFFFGGRYGNQVAQQLAVQTNPYAKMCGAIVKEAMRKELEA
ncbi:hypothetical protein BDV59DRAFT_174634 [Aspergillus ambiguus]|uniref:protein hmgX n=1 Tax=Aspergillus ambiguus TaxID=176160 RepID=UPI003CCD6EBF